MSSTSREIRRAAVREQAERFVVRFPTATEYWFAERTPRIGDTLSRLGGEYAVTAVDASDPECVVVTVAER